jgi:hypothetical protein
MLNDNWLKQTECLRNILQIRDVLFRGRMCGLFCIIFTKSEKAPNKREFQQLMIYL